MLTDKKALMLLEQISAAFDELHRIWDGSIESLHQAEEPQELLAA